MATAITSGRGFRNRLSPEQIAHRKQAAAVAELKRNGVDTEALERLDRLAAKAGPGTIAVAPDEQFELPIAPLPQQQREFVSSPSARPMATRDIQNITFLSVEDAREILTDVAERDPIAVRAAISRVEMDWEELLNERERFCLTALAAKKIEAWRKENDISDLAQAMHEKLKQKNRYLNRKAMKAAAK